MSHEVERQRKLFEKQLSTALAQYNDFDSNAKQTTPTLSSKKTIFPKPGEGPSKGKMQSGFFKLKIIGSITLVIFHF